MMKWKDYPPGFPEYDAYELARRIEDCYEKNKAYIKIRKNGKVPLYGDGYKFEVNLRKRNAPMGKIEKLTQDVQFTLNLSSLQAVRENGVLYLITATPSAQPLNNNLLQITRTAEYKSAFESMSIAHPVGVAQDGEIMICDLTDYPHAMVSGSSKSGKSTALKCLIVSLLKYAPNKMNIILADRGKSFIKFSDLPHLSYPVIYTPETLALVILLLKDEMERRTVLMREDEVGFSKLPYIVCVVDEFPWFIDEINSNKRTEKVIKVINDILRFGRNVNIHIVLSIHDPKDDIAIIEKGDLSVGLVFQVANTRKAMTVLDGAGAEKLKGKGEMIFRYQGRAHRLQGVNIHDEQIETVIQEVMANEFDSEFPRGEYGFSISAEDIEAKKAEITQAIVTSFVDNSVSNKNDDKEPKFAKAVMWTLTQTSVSANLIQRNCKVGNGYAQEFYERLLAYGVIGDSAEKGRLQVLPQSIEDIPDELKEKLYGYGYSDTDILAAISKRLEQ